MSKKDDSPEARTEPILTEQNLDPSVVYSIQVAEGIRGRGFITRLSNDPENPESELANTLRFFVFDPGEPNFDIFTLSPAEALERDLKFSRRKTERDAQRLEQWLKTYYVRPPESA